VISITWQETRAGATGVERGWWSAEYKVNLLVTVDAGSAPALPIPVSLSLGGENV